ncbi:MAG: hypothetical protein DHS20C07_05500 [Methyloligella sp.]|nr:MAG: hypothetical protein DHS20C07_05500 [Methyloligella sp.]
MDRFVTDISDAEILLVTRRLIRSRGVDGFDLDDVAIKVRTTEAIIETHYTEKTSLLRAVKDGVLEDLRFALQNSVIGVEEPAQKIYFICKTYRSFANKQPELFRLMHRPELKTEEFAEEKEVCDPVVQIISQIAGDDHAVSASRFLASFMYGFCTMEIDGSFRLNGSVDEAFEYSLRSYMSGLEGAKNLTFL